MDNGFKLQNCIIQPVKNGKYTDFGCSLHILRLDLVHPIVSGNKLFKLRFYLDQVYQTGKKGIMTFGGAWSNHLVATAWLCRQQGLESVGFVRGVEPGKWSATLQEASSYGMHFVFVPGNQYQTVVRGGASPAGVMADDYLVVPEGGYGPMGMRGAMTILDSADTAPFDWLVCACGTGTMLAGLLAGKQPHQQALGISVLKGHEGLEQDIRNLLPENKKEQAVNLLHDFHFGGYAKKTVELLEFMDGFFFTHSIPTDFVYTGKLMYAVDQLIRKGFFQKEARILAVHSGGLQGNRSLKAGTLSF
jgi:1-aminocyclopropane-1-carboxylate deaminase/D-cysteine desulfhydrase-like pyridoxal-dependent ACC family enzyme